MTKKIIVKQTNNGDCAIINNDSEKSILVKLNEKKLSAKDFYELLNFNDENIYTLESINWTNIDLEGKKNESNRLQKDVYELVERTLNEINKIIQ